jgi:hypothetical protein
VQSAVVAAAKRHKNSSLAAVVAAAKWHKMSSMAVAVLLALQRMKLLLVLVVPYVHVLITSSLKRNILQELAFDPPTSQKTLIRGGDILYVRHTRKVFWL